MFFRFISNRYRILYTCETNSVYKELEITHILNKSCGIVHKYELIPSYELDIKLNSMFNLFIFLSFNGYDNQTYTIPEIVQNTYLDYEHDYVIDSIIDAYLY